MKRQIKSLKHAFDTNWQPSFQFEGCIRCALEPAPEVELQWEKAGQSNSIRDSVLKD